MTNNTDDLTAAIMSATDRRIAQVRADREAFANPIMPTVVNRPAPRIRTRRSKRRIIR